MIAIFKFKALKPYIFQLISATILFVIIPLILFTTGFIVIMSRSNWTLIFIICGACLYIYFFAMYFVPGIQCLSDLITNSFLECNVVYISSYVQEHKFFLREKSLKAKKGDDIYKEQSFLKVLVECDNGKILLESPFYHLMKNDRKYKITFGKTSRVVISILSEDNKELLLYP